MTPMNVMGGLVVVTVVLLIVFIALELRDIDKLLTAIRKERRRREPD